jgi:PAS domain S-box-containing protein
VVDTTATLPLPEPRGRRIAVALAQFAAVLACGLAVLVLVRHRFHAPSLELILPGLLTMAPSAALGVLVAALGLIALTFRTALWLARFCGLILVAFAGLHLLQLILGWDLGLDQVFISPWRIEAGAWIGPLAPGIGGMMALLGLALLFAKGRGAPRLVAHGAAILVLIHALVVLVGFVYGVSPGYEPFPFTAMSIYGVVTVLLLAIGFFAANPESGLAAGVVDPSPAGAMLRRLLPGIVILPLGLGWLALQPELAQRYDIAAIIALFAVSSIVVLAIFALSTVDAVRRADIDRQIALIELQGQREWLSTTLGSIGEAVIATEANGSVLLLNRVAEELTGWPLAEAQGRPIWEVFRVVDEATRKPIDDPALKALRERQMTRVEGGVLLITRDGREIPIENSGAPILGLGGTAAGAVLIFRDITDRLRAAQRQSMLVGELNHRVKNSLAIVQSLVQASIRQASSKPAQAMAETLSERLQALHRAHDLLLESQWSGASLKAMVERELEPYARGEEAKVYTSGPDVLLPPQCTSIIAMTLHELATNAAKYGALSIPTGQLRVTWRTRGNRLQLLWEEQGVVQVQQPKRRSGFGMQLIDRGIRHNLGGETKIEFRPTGLVVQLDIPLDQTQERKAHAAPAAAQ